MKTTESGDRLSPDFLYMEEKEYILQIFYRIRIECYISGLLHWNRNKKEFCTAEVENEKNICD